MTRRVQHDMTDLLWNTLAVFEHPGGASSDVARDLEWQSVSGKESESVPAAESVQAPGCEDDFAIGVLNFPVELVNVGRSPRGEADDFHTFDRCLTQSHDIRLITSLGGEVNHPFLFRGL